MGIKSAIDIDPRANRNVAFPAVLVHMAEKMRIEHKGEPVRSVKFKEMDLEEDVWRSYETTHMLFADMVGCNLVCAFAMQNTNAIHVWLYPTFREAGAKYLNSICGVDWYDDPGVQRAPTMQELQDFHKELG